MAQPLFVGTKGTCLFCLKTNLCCDPLNQNDRANSSVTALKMLFCYLKIDITKVASTSLSLDASTNLGAPLCDSCFSVVDEFLELYQDFERIRLQLDRCTWKLHQFIEEGNKDKDRVRESRRRVVNSEDDVHHKLMEALRKETFEKCLGKLDSSIPQTRLSRGTIYNKLGKGGKQSSPWEWRKDDEDADSTSNGNMEDGMIAEVKVEIESEDGGGINGVQQMLDNDNIPVKVEADDVRIFGAVSRDDEDIIVNRTTNNTTSEQAPAELSPLADVPLAEKATYETEDDVYPTSSVDMTSSTDDLSLTRSGIIGNHRELHTGKDIGSRRVKSVVRCPHCSQYFAGNSNLRVHKYLAHPVQMSTCIPPDITELDVKEALNNIILAINHTSTASQIASEVSCPLCNKTYSNDTILRVHLLRTHEHQLYQTIQRQKHGQHPTKKIMKLTHTSSELKRVHLLETPASISNSTSKNSKITCQKHSGYLKCLSEKGHRGRHRFPKTFKCQLCGQIFLHNRMLQRHLQVFHLQTPSSSSLSCDHCNKIYSRRQSLQFHLNHEHAMLLYAARIPPRISEHAFNSAVTALVPLFEPATPGNKREQKLVCVLCGRLLCCSNVHVRVHIVKFHMDKVIEDADAIVEGSLEIGSSPESVRVPMSEHPPAMIPCKVEDDERGLKYEAEEISRADLDEDVQGIEM